MQPLDYYGLPTFSESWSFSAPGVGAISSELLSALSWVKFGSRQLFLETGSSPRTWAELESLALLVAPRLRRGGIFNTLESWRPGRETAVSLKHRVFRNSDRSQSRELQYLSALGLNKLLPSPFLHTKLICLPQLGSQLWCLWSYNITVTIKYPDSAVERLAMLVRTFRIESPTMHVCKPCIIYINPSNDVIRIARSIFFFLHSYSISTAPERLMS